jgi:hypothetical protein
MKINRGTEFRALVAVSIKVEEEFKGIIGVLFKDKTIKMMMLSTLRRSARTLQ